MTEAALPPRAAAVAATLATLCALPAAGQMPGDTLPTDPAACRSCVEWNAPRAPFLIHGNSYYVGTEGLAAILVTGSAGHVLIDGGLPESAPAIARNIEALGFRLQDVKLILNSHAHFDHAGGIAALQAVTGARVAASPRAAPVLLSGRSGPDDPQYGVLVDFPAARDVSVIGDGETLSVGEVRLTAHFTPGHTPGGTSWSWGSCEENDCADLVYADSQTPVSAEGFSYLRSATYPEAVADFQRSHALLERISCDLLLTPHPGASRLFERVEARDRGALRDPEACRRYARNARDQLERRLTGERGG